MKSLLRKYELLNILDICCLYFFGLLFYHHFSFLANDRPSGTRFIYMLLNGAEDEINFKAFGGYYSKEKEVLTKRSDNTNICKK